MNWITFSKKYTQYSVLSNITFLICLVPSLRSTIATCLTKFFPIGILGYDIWINYKELNGKFPALKFVCAAFGIGDVLIHWGLKLEYAVFPFIGGWLYYTYQLVKLNEKKEFEKTIPSLVLNCFLRIYPFIAMVVLAITGRSITDISVLLFYISLQCVTTWSVYANGKKECAYAMLLCILSDILIIVDDIIGYELYLVTWPMYYIGQLNIVYEFAKMSMDREIIN